MIRIEAPGVTQKRTHQYKVFDFVVDSEFVLPELAAAPDEPATVSIIAHDLKSSLVGDVQRGFDFEATSNVLRLRVPSTATYQIEHGDRILVDDSGIDQAGEPGSLSDDARLYLLGSALGVLLHQRKSIPLHLSSIIVGERVWGFAGASGAGKSTIAALLHYKLGYPLFCDDVLSIDPDGGGFPVHPGPPRVKLWSDALAELGISHENLARDRFRAEKYHLPTPLSAKEHRFLGGIVELDYSTDDQAAEVTQLYGRDALRVIIGSVYRPVLVRLFGNEELLLRVCAELLASVRVLRYTRPRALSRATELLRPLVSCIERL